MTISGSLFFFSYINRKVAFVNAILEQC